MIFVYLNVVMIHWCGPLLVHLEAWPQRAIITLPAALCTSYYTCFNAVYDYYGARELAGRFSAALSKAARERSVQSRHHAKAFDLQVLKQSTRSTMCHDNIRYNTMGYILLSLKKNWS